MHVEPCGLDFVIYMLKYMFCWHIPPLNAVFRWAHATWCQRYHPWAAAHTEKRKTERGEFITPPRPTGRRSNKTPAQAFTPPADEKKMGTIWILVCYAVYGSERGRCRNFLVLKFGGGGGWSWFANMGFKSSTWNRKNCFSNTTGFQHA